jgi:hypothetical protein
VSLAALIAAQRRKRRDALAALVALLFAKPLLAEPYLRPSLPQGRASG